MATVLVIDDDEMIRDMLDAALQSAGHRVTLAENGKVGMAKFMADPADLVITDLIMPEQEGVETIMLILRQFPQQPIIAMSGGGPRAETYLYMCTKLGVRCTLPKPFSVDVLYKAVNSALEPLAPDSNGHKGD